MIRQKRIVFEVLIFGLAISTASEISTSQQQTEPATPTEVFTQRTQIFSSDDTAYYDLDDYVPYRSDAHDYFSWRLLTEVLLEDQENIIVSPFSVKLVLAMIAEAAGNNTKTKNELMGTLTDIRSLDNLRGFYKKVLFSIKKENPYHTFNLETKLFTDSFIEPLQRYEATLHSFYFTNIQRLNFANTHQAATTINEWCANVTNGRLNQLVNEDNLQNNVMLMANAIYFSGLWRRQFNSTFQGTFFKAQTEQIKVQYMEQTEYFYYYDSSKLDAKILRLPYKGKKFSMFFLLPKTKWGVDELIHNLVNDEFKGIQFMMEEVKIKVTLPKFKFEFNKNLKDTLARLGINEIFTDNASLPGLARGADVARKLKVSNIFQKAGVDVNESGTEAFASTVVEIENKFGGSTVIEEFNVNRPFLFIIEDESTGNIIFAGKVLKPLV